MEEILADFEEYFACARARRRGRSRRCVRASGDPKKIAQGVLCAQKAIEEANQEEDIFGQYGESRAIATSAGLSIANFFYVLICRGGRRIYRHRWHRCISRLFPYRPRVPSPHWSAGIVFAWNGRADCVLVFPAGKYRAAGAVCAGVHRAHADRQTVPACEYGVFEHDKKRDKEER